MNRSEQIGELAGALAKAQAKIEAALKDKTARAGQYSYTYATLAGVWAVCRAPLTENGLAVIQTVTTDGAAAHVSTLLAHSSGQWVEETLTMTAADASPQKIGSAITYGRRYSLGAMVGVVTDDDDDGKAASENHDGQGYQRKQPAGNGKPTAKQGVSAEEQAYVRLAEALPGSWTEAEKTGWKEAHRAEIDKLPAMLKNALVEDAKKVPVRA